MYDFNTSSYTYVVFPNVNLTYKLIQINPTHKLITAGEGSFTSKTYM